MFDKEMHELIVDGHKYIKIKEESEFKPCTTLKIVNGDNVIRDDSEIFGKMVEFTGKWRDDNQLGKTHEPLM